MAVGVGVVGVVPHCGGVAGKKKAVDLYDPDYVTALGSLLDASRRILLEAFDSGDEFENCFKVVGMALAPPPPTQPAVVCHRRPAGCGALVAAAPSLLCICAWTRRGLAAHGWVWCGVVWCGGHSSAAWRWS